MNEIATINKTDFEGVKYPVTVKSETIFNSPTILKIDKKTLLGYVLGQVTKLHQECGQEANLELLKQLSVSFTQSLLENYKTITVNEIESVFKQGRKNQLGEYFGLNLNTFEKWLDTYYNTKRQEIVKRRSTKQQEQKLTKSEIEEKNRIAIENAKVEIVKHYKENKEINPCLVFLYKHLLKEGELPEQTTDYVLEVKKRAMNKLNKKIIQDGILGKKLRQQFITKSLSGACREVVLEDWVNNQLK